MKIKSARKIKFKLPTRAQAVRTLRFKSGGQFLSSRVTIRAWGNIAVNDKVFLLTHIFWLTCVIIILALIISFFPKLPAEVPLYFSRIWGESQLANKTNLLVLPIGLFTLGTFNLGFAVTNYSRDKLTAYMLCFTSVIISLLSLIAVINIIHLVT